MELSDLLLLLELAALGLLLEVALGLGDQELRVCTHLLLLRSFTALKRFSLLVKLFPQGFLSLSELDFLLGPLSVLMVRVVLLDGFPSIVVFQELRQTRVRLRRSPAEGPGLAQVLHRTRPVHKHIGFLGR